MKKSRMTEGQIVKLRIETQIAQTRWTRRFAGTDETQAEAKGRHQAASGKPI